MDINSLIIVGRLTRDEELTYTTGGTAVGKFAIASNRLKDKQGNVPVDYFDVVIFGKQAEGLKAYLVKGKQVAIQGRLQQDRWTDKEGKNQSRISIVADNIQLIGGVKADSQPQQQTQNFQPVANNGFADDIPF